METSWSDLISEAIQAKNDTLICCTLTDEEANKIFTNQYGRTYAIAFTAWGESFVYFPLINDGMVSVGSAPRNPCKIACKLQPYWY